MSNIDYNFLPGGAKSPLDGQKIKIVAAAVVLGFVGYNQCQIYTMQRQIADLQLGQIKCQEIAAVQLDATQVFAKDAQNDDEKPEEKNEDKKPVEEDDGLPWYHTSVEVIFVSLVNFALFCMAAFSCVLAIYFPFDTYSNMRQRGNQIRHAKNVDNSDIFLIQAQIQAQITYREKKKETLEDPGNCRAIGQLIFSDNYFEEYIDDSSNDENYGLKSSLKMITKYGYVIITAQVLALSFILGNMISDRKIGFYTPDEFILRFLFSFIILFVINKDKSSLHVYQAFITTGLLGDVTTRYYFTYCIRLLISYSSVPILFFYIFSIDEGETESRLELVQNFASLLILLDIDNLVADGLQIYLREVKIDDVLNQDDLKDQVEKFMAKEDDEKRAFHKWLTGWKVLFGIIGNYYINWFLILFCYGWNLIF